MITGIGRYSCLPDFNFPELHTMTRHHRLPAAALFVCLSLAGASAHAAKNISVGASLSNASMTVIDLTPDDQQAAGYRFDHVSGSSVDATMRAPAAAWSQTESASSAGYEPVSATVVNGASTSVSSAGSWANLRTDVQLYDSLDPKGDASGNVTQELSVLVAPHTQLVFSAYGEVSIASGGNDFIGNAVTTVILGSQYWSRSMIQGGGQNDSGVRGQTFSMSYVNNSDSEQYLRMYMNTLTRSRYQGTSPVPEPETYAMLGLGMLVVGAAARRHRQASAVPA